MKICTKCGQEKPEKEFSKDKYKPGGIKSWCKECVKCNNVEYIKKNKDKVARKAKLYRETHKGERAEYNKRNKNEIKNQQAAYKQKHAVEIREYTLSFREKHKNDISKKQALYAKNRCLRDQTFKLRCNLRSRLYNALKHNIKAGSAVRDLGCTIEELKVYLESLFQPGMTWENHGTHGWHIDHVKPLSSFDLTDREQFLKACHYSNLQPLWAEENWKKGSSCKEVN